MVTIFLPGGVSISALLRPAQLEQSCYQRAFQQPYNVNHQQLNFVPRFIQKVEWNVLCNGHRLLEIGQSVLQSFGRSKQRSQLYHRQIHPSSWSIKAPNEFRTDKEDE